MLKPRLIRTIALLTLTVFLPGCPNPAGPAGPVGGAKLPPTGAVSRTNPRLVNYFHAWWCSDVSTPGLNEMLAQWDMIILDPDGVRAGKYPGISFGAIRALNPDIKILGWIPTGQSPADFSDLNDDLYDRISGSIDSYTARTRDGAMITPFWGGYIMNTYKNSYLWPQAIKQHVDEFYFGAGAYTFDGVMLDILSESAPTFASPDTPQTIDVDEDGDFDSTDHVRWREGVDYLLHELRAAYPDKILIGNGGVPWSGGCSYFTDGNGCMHENALGNEFGSADWTGMWNGYGDNMNPAAGVAPARVHLMQVDVRYDRDQAAAEALTSLSAEDLRRMRLGLGASLLMDGGYSGFDRGDCLHGQLWWFDEYDYDLGVPAAPYQQNAYASGTYSREYARGTVIVNPTGAGVNVVLAASRLNTTTGETGTVFLIPPGDARIFYDSSAP